jgi:transaldolase
MRPVNLQSKIFLDSGDPEETHKILDMMGFLDGQTTNPTLLSKDPEIIKDKAEGKITRDTIFPLYRNDVSKISALIPDGSVSVEVFADLTTTTEDMLKQAHEMYTWIPNAHIKFPSTKEGLDAAHSFSGEGNRVNLTLCFSQAQAAATYSATMGAKRGDVFVSPFIGRLDDIGVNGISLIQNILTMYGNSDHHVEVLAASIRSVEQMLAALAIGCDILTVRFSVLEEWTNQGMPLPGDDFHFDTSALTDIPYEDLTLSDPYTSFNLAHELTTKGIEKFTNDINALLA